MASFSGFTLLLGAATSVLFTAFAYLTIRIHAAKPADLRWRGIIKLVSLNGVPQELAALYPLWFKTLVAFFISTSLLAANLAWATDHSFFVVLFPLLFYYFFARYFFWEKADLID